MHIDNNTLNKSGVNFCGKCKQTHAVHRYLYAVGDPLRRGHSAYAAQTTITAWSENITLLTDVFLRLIKMVIAPLVFSTLTVGIMRLGETATIGRVGGKAMVWFVTSSILSILVGLVIVTLEHPGAGLNLAIPKESVDTGLAVSGMSLKGFLTHTIPTSITEAMANNEILQIVVFSMFFGIAGASLGEKFNARWWRP